MLIIHKNVSAFIKEHGNERKKRRIIFRLNCNDYLGGGSPQGYSNDGGNSKKRKRKLKGTKIKFRARDANRLNPFCRLDIFDRKMTVEGELVLRCRYAANEEEGSAAIRALFAVMQPAIQKFVRSKAESAEDAEDVIQRTFEKLSRAIFELDDPDKVKAWCFRVAGNHLRDLWRAKQHRGKSVPLFESAADPAMASYFRAKEPNPSEETECIDLWRIIEQAGNSEDVLLVRLYYLEGKTHAEIGDGLKIPKSTVRTRIANVLQKAKVIYERDARKLA